METTPIGHKTMFGYGKSKTTFWNNQCQLTKEPIRLTHHVLMEGGHHSTEQAIFYATIAKKKRGEKLLISIPQGGRSYRTFLKSISPVIFHCKVVWINPDHNRTPCASSEHKLRPSMSFHIYGVLLWSVYYV